MSQQLNELLLQALETEIGGVQIYQAALRCVVNAALVACRLYRPV
jgi:hypothetical protein